jgi:uncharacterized protein YfaS (alpha-2-macroglobulin family)
VPHGGGGGRGAARERFDTLLAWHGRVPLDADGRARVEIPLNDALTAFRIVAIAQAGAGHFGTGTATIRTSQELMLHAGLPPLVREGDRFDATFTVRNATDRAMMVDARARVGDGEGTGNSLPAQSFALAPGAAHALRWQVDVPAGPEDLRWDVEVAEREGAAHDRLALTQPVIPAWPVRTWQATLARLDQPLRLVAGPPGGAVAGRGGVEVTFDARLGGAQPGVREYMGRYGYTCIEQLLSRAVALRDEKLWHDTVGRMPAYLDRDGLLRYFPSEWLDGSDVLTSYVLAVAAEAGWKIPEETRTRMLEALGKFVDGRIERHSPLPAADLPLRKLAAIAALARHDAAEPAMLSSITIAPVQWPTSAVLDWLDILDRLPGIADADARRTGASRILRGRLDFQGTIMRFAREDADALWWLMVSGDVNAVRAILVLLDDPAWHADLPRLVRGALGRQRDGHWDTTTANAWGMLALARFSAVFEATPVAGSTTVSYGGEEQTVEWREGGDAHALTLPWRPDPGALVLTHAGSGQPWAMVASRAALPLTAPVTSGFTIARTVTPVEQQTPGVWTQGDVARVTLTLEAQADSGWVVVDDPVPAGASILGSGLGRDTELLTQGERRAAGVEPAYEERRFEAFRAYYRYVPAGTWTVEYMVRFNNPGRFVLPATRVEAMYAPEAFAALPNAALEVAAP